MEPWHKIVTSRRKVREVRSFNPDEFAIALTQTVPVGRSRFRAWCRLAEERQSGRTQDSIDTGARRRFYTRLLQ